jgi:hypothetical protein
MGISRTRWMREASRMTAVRTQKTDKMQGGVCEQ